MPRRILSSSILGLAALAAAAYASRTSGPRMGPEITVKRPAFHGYYDGHKYTYLNTDVSSKAQAKAMHVNYSPVLKTVPLSTAPEIYLVEGKAAAAPVVIKSDTQVDQLEKKGGLTEHSTSIRLNCPIIKIGKGS